MGDLKPCPFCGGAPIMEVLGNLPSTHRTIRCSKCKCDLHYQHTEEKAVAAWNTRTPEDVNKALLDALRLILDIGAGDFNGQMMECYCGSVEGDDGDLDEEAKCAVCKGRAAIKQAESQTKEGE